MLPLIRSAHSEEDLIAIWRYVAIEASNPTAADRLLRLLDRRIEMLASNPYLGEQQPQFGERTRRLIVGNYLVYYDVLEDAVHVLRIYHAARRIDKLYP
ncbi:MAG: type II toxin-antitoxin system RelE/ParE family toxin [Bythopirellula sp.]|nr:type II toxin-antitoxin system RelE/ParE family toxin [Bythopirellula sp.]